MACHESGTGGGAGAVEVANSRLFALTRALAVQFGHLPGKPAPSTWGERTHSWSSGFRGQAWVRKAKRGLAEEHSYVWLARLSLAVPVSSLKAQLPAPPLTFKIKDQTLHDGALASNITWIGRSAQSHSPWFDRQESVTNSWRPDAGDSGKPPLPAIPGAGASLEPGAARKRGTGRSHAGPGPGSGPRVTGRASARRPLKHSPPSHRSP